MTRGKLLHVFRGHEGWAAGVAFSPDGTKLASTGQDGAVRIWDVSARPGSEPRSDSACSDLARSHGWGLWRRVQSRWDQARLGRQRWDCPRLGFDRETAANASRLSGTSQEVCCVAFHPGGTLIASGGADRMVRIWDAATGRQIREFHAATSRVNAIAFSPDGTRLATGSLEHTVNVWEAATGRPIVVFAGHAAPVIHVAFNADGTKLVSASQDATVKLWDLTSEPGVRQFQLEREREQSQIDRRVDVPNVGWVGGVAFRPSATSWLRPERITRSGSGTPPPAGLKRELRDGWGVMIALAYNRQGLVWRRSGPIDMSGSGTSRRRAAAGGFGHARGARQSRVQPRRQHAGHGRRRSARGDPGTGRQIPGGREAMHGRSASGIQPTAVRSARSRGHVGSIHALAFSPDGTRFASAGADGIVRIWDPATGEVRLALEGHSSAIFGVAFSPDGKQIGLRRCRSDDSLLGRQEQAV